jgi:hypothetical protein
MTRKAHLGDQPSMKQHSAVCYMLFAVTGLSLPSTPFLVLLILCKLVHIHTHTYAQALRSHLLLLFCFPS